MSFEVRRLSADDIAAMREMNSLFGDVFEDPESYHSAPPGDAYLHSLLARDEFIALAAWCEGAMVGALAGYELIKFEQRRSEIYIYDLAVRDEFWRQGIATGLIDALKGIARAKGGSVIFVQADPVDLPAVALYEKLGVREEVLHFDISADDGR